MAQQFDPDARFKRLREQAKQEATASTQRQQEALKRRFARAGLGSSGAAIKQAALTEQRGEQALSRRLGDIESAQEQEASRRAEIEKGREFAAGEAAKGRAFQAEQAGIGRKFAAGQAQLGREHQANLQSAQQKFARGERLSSQEFAALQAEAQRGFAAGEAAKGREFAAGQSELQRAFQKQMTEAAQAIQQSQFGSQMDLAMKQFELDERVTNFNIGLAEAEANKQTMFDKLGNLGTNGWKQLIDPEFIMNPAGSLFNQTVGTQLGIEVPSAGGAVSSIFRR